MQTSADLCLYHARDSPEKRREMTRLKNSARSDGSNNSSVFVLGSRREMARTALNTHQYFER